MAVMIILPFAPIPTTTCSTLLALLTRQFQGAGCARVRSVANLMPVADTGCVAGSTTGIMAETSLRSDAAKESVAI